MCHGQLRVLVFPFFHFLPSLGKIYERPYPAADCHADNKGCGVFDNLDSSDENRKHVEHFRQAHRPASDEHPRQDSEYRKQHRPERDMPFKKEQQVPQHRPQHRAVLVQVDMPRRVRAIREVRDDPNFHDEGKKPRRHDDSSAKAEDCQKDLSYQHPVPPPSSRPSQSMPSEFHSHRYASVLPTGSDPP